MTKSIISIANCKIKFCKIRQLSYKKFTKVTSTCFNSFKIPHHTHTQIKENTYIEDMQSSFKIVTSRIYHIFANCYSNPSLQMCWFNNRQIAKKLMKEYTIVCLCGKWRLCFSYSPQSLIKTFAVVPAFEPAPVTIVTK